MTQPDFSKEYGNNLSNQQISEEKPIIASSSSKSDERGERLFNILFGIMIIFTIIGTGIIIQKLNAHCKELIELAPEYNFPNLNDLIIVPPLVIFLAVMKILIEKISLPIAKFFTAKKYQNPEDESNFLLGKIYLKKNASNLYKMTFFLCVVPLGYSILYQTDYFPTSLMGKGDLKNMFAEGFPKTLLHNKPAFMDTYYLIGLAFCWTDLIWLIFFYELQSDFIMMVLHHVCTISLITFSYLSNWSNIGCIVLFLHDFTDIFVYTTRLIVNSDSAPFWKIAFAVKLIIVFIYLRIYVFYQVIYNIYVGITWEYRGPEVCLTVFLCFLYVMHLYWVYLIFQKIMKGVFEKKYEDPAHIKKYEKSN